MKTANVVNVAIDIGAMSEDHMVNIMAAMQQKLLLMKAARSAVSTTESEVTERDSPVTALLPATETLKLLTKVVPDNLMPESHSFLPEVEAEFPALPPMAHQWHDCMDEEGKGIRQLTELDNIQHGDISDEEFAETAETPVMYSTDEEAGCSKPATDMDEPLAREQLIKNTGHANASWASMRFPRWHKATFWRGW